MVITYLAILGLCFGSFVNALVWRIHKNKDWVKQRSQCTHCGHKLGTMDLIPVVSWLILGGKCRYCHKVISVQYPIVELVGAFVFTFSYTYWPASFDSAGQVGLFVSWLAVSVGLLALLVYDFKWMLLPNKLIYPTLVLAALGNLFYLLVAPDKLHFFESWVASILVASGIFWLLFTISKGKWIGYGDVRLGLITGTLLHNPAISFLMLFLASVLGTLFVIPSLISKQRGFNAKLPFGPFLITATFVCILFGESIIHWYQRLAGL